MKTYKACVIDKETKKAVVIESEQPSKANFIRNLRHNGYQVCDWRVKEASVYDYIVEQTNCQKEDWFKN